MMGAILLFVFYHTTAQTKVYITGSEFHWTRGAVAQVVQPKIGRQLIENGFHIVSDSNSADYIIRVKCHSYANGQTQFFFFGLLDAKLWVYDKKNAGEVWFAELNRIKGGSPTPESADDKVYSNSARIIADTLTRYLYRRTTGKLLPGFERETEFEPLCSADSDIPELPPARRNTYVLIIANDSYSPMQMARCVSDSIDDHSRDARVFREYAIRTLGIPQGNVQIILNAKSFEMRREIIRLASYSRGVNGNAELIFYYAGYGMIDEKTLEPFILPVDVENDDPKFFISISDLYKMLQEDASKRITILLESSFRFDALKPLPDKIKTNKIRLRYPNVPANVFFMAAASPGQRTWSDHQSGHSLFTLSLLSKLKETRGKASLKELSEYIIQDVRTTSLKMKLKEQVPNILCGSALTKDISVLKL